MVVWFRSSEKAAVLKANVENTDREKLDSGLIVISAWSLIIDTRFLIIFYGGLFSTLSLPVFYVRIGFKAVVWQKNERKQNQYFSAGLPWVI